MSIAEVEIDLVTSAGGNIGSMSRCLKRLGVKFHHRGHDASSMPDGSRPIVLPGVGAFGQVMDSLKENNFAATLKQLIKDGTPFLGVCVGMQVLFDESEEAPGTAGLGLIPGKVVKYTQGKVPQIGWNKIQPAAAAANPATALHWPQEEGYVYFVNSYFARPADHAVTLYSADYGGTFCAAVKKDNITAFQFHPEKSGDTGETLIKSWLREVASC